MRIAVTGANGRLGRGVVTAALKEGHEVVALDRVTGPAEGEQDVRAPFGTLTVPVQEVDITHYDNLLEHLAAAQADALVHLAAIPGPGGTPDHLVHATNVLGNYHALRAATELGIRRVVCASSINAIGGIYSKQTHYDYLPVDEEHPTYAEDAYSLSKWLGEQQADAFVRREPGLTVASLRFHGITPHPPTLEPREEERVAFEAKHLWGWVGLEAASRACLLGLTADFTGHEVFFVVAPTTTSALDSEQLRRRYHPDVDVRTELSGQQGFYDCGKAARVLGWSHDG